MTNKTKIFLIAAALLSAYAVGRFTAPEHVKIQEKIVEVEKKSEKKDIDKQNHKKTTVVTVTKPDGTKTTTSVTTDESETKTKDNTKSVSSVTTEKSKEITNSSSKVTISALAGINPFALEKGPDYGLSASRPIIGPFTIGIFVFKSGMSGASAGLTF